MPPGGLAQRTGGAGSAHALEGERHCVRSGIPVCWQGRIEGADRLRGERRMVVSLFPRVSCPQPPFALSLSKGRSNFARAFDKPRPHGRQGPFRASLPPFALSLSKGSRQRGWELRRSYANRGMVGCSFPPVTGPQPPFALSLSKGSRQTWTGLCRTHAERGMAASLFPRLNCPTPVRLELVERPLERGPSARQAQAERREEIHAAYLPLRSP